MIKFTLPLLIFADTAMACPFCDEGGIDTVIFVFTVFGLFAAAMLFLLLSATKAGTFRNESTAAQSVLIAEDILTKKDQ